MAAAGILKPAVAQITNESRRLPSEQVMKPVLLLLRMVFEEIPDGVRGVEEIHGLVLDDEDSFAAGPPRGVSMFSS